MPDVPGRAPCAAVVFAQRLCQRVIIVVCVCAQPISADEPVALPAVPEFAALRGSDLNGNLHRFADDPELRGTAFVFISIECPISNSYLPAIKQLATECRRSKIAFFGVISDAAVNRADAKQHRSEYKLTFPVLFDVSGELRRYLHATHTPHAFLVSRTGEPFYAGRIDNLYSALGQRRDSATEHDFHDAIQALAAGHPAPRPLTEPVGCLLEVPPEENSLRSVTFNRDIAPIVYANCSECHRPGEATPFTLLDYADTSRHALQIAAVTQSRFMPPWHPSPEFGHFQHDRRLSAEDIDLFRQWVAAGKPEGDPDDLLVPPTFFEGWRLGTPDLVLMMKQPFELPADGPDVHQHFVLPTGLKNHRLVSAIEFRPGNPRVTHHASFYIDTTREARKLEDREPDVGYGSFVGPGFANVNSLRSWLPGMSPQHLPTGSGELLPAHSDIVAEIHYRCSGKVESDRSMIGIHFANPSARQVVSEFQVMNKALTIPAGATRHHHAATFTVPVDVMLLDAVPHMHLLGRELKAVAVHPDGTVVPLVWIRNWDFNWQGQYLYSEPLLLPQGTRIDVETWFDNSADNPLNPYTPPRTVTWGEQTREEMGICLFRYTTRTLADLQKVHTHYIQYAADQQRIFEQLPKSEPLADK